MTDEKAPKSHDPESGGAISPDPEFDPRHRRKGTGNTRRRFTAAYKLRILAEADGCTTKGAIGALLRREGLYSSHLTNWRRQRDGGALAGLDKKRGRKPDPSKEAKREIAKLQRENERLRRRLAQKEAIIRVQKNSRRRWD